MKKMNKVEIPLNDLPVASPGVPVYLISTTSKSGVRNIAPYGMVMPVSHNPPIYAIGSDKDRDTYRNIVETKDFAKQKGQLDPLYYVRGAYFGLGRYVGKR